MQGWRKKMEDSHISQIDLGPNNFTHIFGVFDGHGGNEVSKYVKNHFEDEFLQNNSYKVGDIKNALIETFNKMDQLLLTENGIREIEEYSKISKEEDKIINNKEMSKNMEVLHDFFNDKCEEEKEIITAMNVGCTANVCVIDSLLNKIYFANAGDSRAVLCKDGIAFQMSIDHKPELENEKNRIEKANGFITGGRVNGKY